MIRSTLRARIDAREQIAQALSVPCPVRITHCAWCGMPKRNKPAGPCGWCVSQAWDEKFYSDSYWADYERERVGWEIEKCWASRA